MFKKILTRTILIVSFVSLFTDIASEMLYPVMPVYLRSIGFSLVLIGILEGLAEATAGLSKGYFGNLSDKTGKRVPFVRWGYLLSAISKPMMALFIYPIWIFFARTLDRLGKGVRTGSRDAMLSDETSRENKGKVFGFHRAMDTLGAAIGPFGALIFLHYYPGQYKWLFFIAFVPGIIAISLTFLLKDKHTPASSKTKVGFLTYLKYWGKAGLNYKLLVAGLLLFTLFNSSDAFLLLAIKNQGLTDTAMIGVYIFYNLIYALLAFPVGIIADRIGLRTTMVGGLFVFAMVYFFMGFAVTVSQFVVLFGFYALYAASTEGISKALITNLADKHETATAIGFYTSLASIFTMLASSLAGVLWFSLGPRIMFIISGSGVAVAAIFLATNRLILQKKQQEI
ncbi:MAG TPA: MFS transporter [Bacteroidales bacterium]|nr:MFS transporter [Bacteroidales bacterium]